MFKLCNWYLCAQRNPFAKRNSSFPKRPTLNVLLEVFFNHLIGPHVFWVHLSSNTYLDVLKRHLLGLLNVFPAFQCADIIFQHLGTLFKFRSKHPDLVVSPIDLSYMVNCFAIYIARELEYIWKNQAIVKHSKPNIYAESYLKGYVSR